MTDQPASDSPTTSGEQRRVLSAMCLALVLVVASVSAVTLALPDLAVAFDRRWTEPVVIVSFVVCAVSLAAYAAYGLRTDEPLLDPGLFGLPGFRAGSISVIVQFMAVFGFFFVGLQYLQLILGYSRLRSTRP